MAPFPVEMTGVSVIVPSPSGAKLLVVRNSEAEAPCQFEIWGPAQVGSDFQIPQSVHGSVYADEWFQGISWNSDETLIAYVAEEPFPPMPTFTCQGYKNGSSTPDEDMANWKGKGEWEEDWGETYVGKRKPALFVINTNSGETQAIKGIETHLSVGQVVWAPAIRGSHQYLVLLGGQSIPESLGLSTVITGPVLCMRLRHHFMDQKLMGEVKLLSECLCPFSLACVHVTWFSIYCTPTYDILVEFLNCPRDCSIEDFPVVKLTQSISSAYHPCFSPDGKLLLFLSSRSAVVSGAHSATNSLHRIDWPIDGVPCSSGKIFDLMMVASLDFMLRKLIPRHANTRCKDEEGNMNANKDTKIYEVRPMMPTSSKSTTFTNERYIQVQEYTT